MPEGRKSRMRYHQRWLKRRILPEDQRMLIFRAALDFCLENKQRLAGRALQFIEITAAKEINDISNRRFSGVKNIAKKLAATENGIVTWEEKKEATDATK